MMKDSIEYLTQEVLALSIEERAVIAARIVESIDNGREISPAWLDVAEKRRDEVLSGKARTVDASEVSSLVRRHIA